MKLSLETIYTNRITCHSDTQITLEDDINVPDTKPDIDFIIKEKSSLKVTETKSQENQVLLRGYLSFRLLYSSNDDIRPVHNMQGQVPFEETIYMEGLTPSEDVFCHYDLEDCQIHLINSRKISLRAIASFHCQVEEDTKHLAGVDIVDENASRADMENTVPEGLHKRFETISYTQSTPRQKDVFRIKDEVTLPKGKPNMDTILYYEMTPQNIQTRLVEDGLRLSGDLRLFVLYTPEEEDRRMEYLETELPIDGMVPCSGCREEMIPDISFLPLEGELEIKEDEDGERRILELEETLELTMKFYEENSMEILQDAYSTAWELSLTKDTMEYEELLMKTQNIVRISEQITIEEEEDKMLQICTAAGKIQIDEQKVEKDGIALEGVVELDILYITENDARPLGHTKGMIPFQHFLEIKGMEENNQYLLQSDISQISVMMPEAGEVDAKVTINLGAIVFTPVSREVIVQIQEEPQDLNRLQQMPGIVGFIAGKDTTLWDLAKEYQTSPESIMELNGLTTQDIHPGDRLLLVKQVDGL
jgi:hypothetical protein